jgi:plastocyanin
VTRTAALRSLRLWSAAVTALLAASAAAAPPSFELEIRNHLFQPDVLKIPANTKVRLVVTNRDATPEEFESFELNREKVIMGGTKAIIFVGPLPPGEYPFFGEFNPNTALGKIVVEDKIDAGD